MLIALLSDTHDNVATTTAALELLAPYKPAAYLHAGDLVSPHMLDLFKGLPFHFVFGNNEYDLTTLRTKALALNLHCHEQFADLTLAGKRIAITHGHTRHLPNALRDGNFHYIIYGHSHVKADEKRGTTRLINPGALHRATTKTAALLDLSTNLLQYLTVSAR